MTRYHHLLAQLGSASTPPGSQHGEASTALMLLGQASATAAPVSARMVAAEAAAGRSSLLLRESRLMFLQNTNGNGNGNNVPSILSQYLPYHNNMVATTSSGTSTTVHELVELAARQLANEMVTEHLQRQKQQEEQNHLHQQLLLRNAVVAALAASSR